MNGPELTVLGLVIVALITGGFGYLGIRATNKANATNVAATNAIKGREVDLTTLKDSVADLVRRLAAVEDDLEHEKDQRRMSNAYARTLAQVLRKHGMPVPPPPADLDIDL